MSNFNELVTKFVDDFSFNSLTIDNLFSFLYERGYTDEQIANIILILILFNIEGE